MNPVPPTVLHEYKRDETTAELTNEPVRDEPILCHEEFASQIPLSVPDEAVDAYKNAPGWKHFTQIYPISALSRINDILASDRDATVIGRYDLNGNPVYESYRGIAIIRYSDGSARKVAQH